MPVPEPFSRTECPHALARHEKSGLAGYAIESRLLSPVARGIADSSGCLPEQTIERVSIGRLIILQSAGLQTCNRPMSSPVSYPRSVERRPVEALEDSPVVPIHGPRQCGKTTLAQFTCAPRPRRRPNSSTRGRPASPFELGRPPDRGLRYASREALPSGTPPCGPSALSTFSASVRIVTALSDNGLGFRGRPVHKPTVSTDASRRPERVEGQTRTDRFIVDNSRPPRSATVNSPAVRAMKSSAFATRSAPRPSP